jgi:hypothetical protein
MRFEEAYGGWQKESLSQEEAADGGMQPDISAAA